MMSGRRVYHSLIGLMVPCLSVVLLLIYTPHLTAQDSCAKILEVAWKKSTEKDFQTFAACYGNKFDMLLLSGWAMASMDDLRLDTATFGMLRVVLDSLRSTSTYATKYQWWKEETEKERQQQEEREANKPPPLCDKPLYDEKLSSAAGIEIPWYFNLDQALACARQLDRPVFLFFTAYTDVNSGAMRRESFTDDSVRSLLTEQFVPVALFTDGRSQMYYENKALLKERFHKAAIPYLVIISPDDRTITESLGFMKTSELLKFLNDGLRRIR
jgi:hypothetical protein